MKYIYLLSLIILVILSLWKVILKKEIFSLVTISFFLNFNFILYLFGWSGYASKNINYSVYLILIYLNLLVCICDRIFPISKGNKVINRDYKKISLNFGKASIDILILINIVYLFMVLLENYLICKMLFPVLKGYDVHTSSYPLISFITNNAGVLGMVNYMAIRKGNYKKSSKVVYALFILIDYFSLFLTRGARMKTLIWCIQLLIFIMIVEKIRINMRKCICLLLGVITIGAVFVWSGDSRVNKNGKYDYTYTNGIKYTGPSDDLGILAWYYGYFPMSFDVLNKSIINAKKLNYKNTYGIYTFTPILEGIFELDNVIDNYPNNTNDKYRIYSTGYMTVPTGFYDFYIDFGDLNFLSIYIYICITYFFYKYSSKDCMYSMMYSIMLTAWILMSFQNTLISVITFYGVIFSVIFTKVFFNTKRVDDNICLENE